VSCQVSDETYFKLRADGFVVEEANSDNGFPTDTNDEKIQYLSEKMDILDSDDGGNRTEEITIL
jgi:hypothetical protein